MSTNSIASAIARNSKPEAPKPPVAETDAAEREQAKAAAKAERARVKEQKREEAKEVANALRQQKAEAKTNAPDCGCGCGHTTRGGRYLPGHDARLHGRVKRQIEGRLDRDALSQGERDAVDTMLGVGHVPGGSFTPQEAKSHGAVEIAKSEKAVLILMDKRDKAKAAFEAAEAVLAEAQSKLDEQRKANGG